MKVFNLILKVLAIATFIWAVIMFLVSSLREPTSYVLQDEIFWGVILIGLAVSAKVEVKKSTKIEVKEVKED